MRVIKKGAVDQTLYFDILDSASTTGGRKTTIAYNAAGLKAYYTRAGAAAAAITLATQTDAGAHSDGGWVAVHDTNSPGLYRLDLPDAVCAAGVDAAVVTVFGAAGMVQASIEIQLVAVDVQDSVRGGLTALPNAAADAPGGLPISDAGGLDMDSVKADTAAILVDTGTTLDGRIPAALVSGRMDASVGAVAANAITAASIATDAIDADAIAADAVTEIQSGLALDSTVAKDATVSKPGTAQTISSNADMTAIKAKTDNLPASPAAVGSEMLLTVAYDAAKTAATQASLDALDLVADAVKVKTDQLAFSAGAVQADLTKVAGSATVDGLSLVNMFKSFITFARGKIVKTGNAYTYKAQDGTTTLFTNTASFTDRTPS